MSLTEEIQEDLHHTNCSGRDIVRAQQDLIEACQRFDWVAAESCRTVVLALVEANTDAMIRAHRNMEKLTHGGRPEADLR